MKTMTKRFLSLFMVFVMLLGMIPTQVFADGATSPSVKIALDEGEDPECTCGAAEGEPHAEGCPLYEAPEEEAPVTVTVAPAAAAMLSTDAGSRITAAVVGAENAEVTWSVVSGGNVVTVEGSGLTATVRPASENASGEAVVRASCQPEGKKEAVYADCTVTVTRVQKTLEVTPSQVSMFVSSLGANLTAAVMPAGSSVTAEWTSSDPAVATVDAGGHVTPVSAGTAVITASAQGMTSTCTVTVKEVKYRVVYNSNYPADAKKFAYQNGNKNSGKDSSPLVNAEDTNAVYEVQNGQSHTIIPGMTCANYDFVGWSLVSGSAEVDSTCVPGTQITVDDNLTFYAVWQKNTATTTKTVYIDYCYVDANGKSIKNTRSATAYLVGQDESGNELYSFQLGNCADGLVTAAQNDRTVRGWIINGTNYNFNATCTTTLDADGHVRADAWQDTSLVEEEAFAQFFVHKYRVSPGGSVGTATVDYYSVGTGKVKVVLQKVKDRVGGNVSDDVSAYVLEAPSAAQIASALQIPLSESENIRWFKVIWADDGYHVDGVIYSINKNWTVKFIDPLAGNKVVRSVSVEDKGSLNSFPAGPIHAGEEFECWVDEAGKPISAIDVVVQDRTVYAKYKDKVMLTGVIDYGTVTNASQTVVSNQKTQAMVFTADDNRVITSVHVNDKAQSIKANQKTYTFTARNLTANTYVVVTTKGADALIRFDANGGTGEPSPVKGEFGAAVESPFPTKQPVRPGYTFDGWYTEPNGGSRVVGFPDTFDKLETVYYAHWQENVVTVTITGNHLTTVYDGQEHKATGYTVSSDNPAFTAADVSFSGTAEAATTDAAKVAMGLDKSQFTSTNPNFSKVNFVVVDGYVEVTPLDVTVTVTGNTDSKPFDGQEHTVSGYKFESSDALYTQSNVTFTGTAEAKRTQAGTTPMGLSDKDFANTNPNFHVDFNVIDGGMTITKADAVVVTITGNSETVTYDGREHKVTGYTFTSDNPLYKASDFTFTGTAEAKTTDAATVKMGLDASRFTNNNTNFDNVTFVVNDGYIKVEPLAVNVAIEGNSVTADYDGQEHTASGYTVTSDSKLYNSSNIAFSGEAAAKRTEEGQTPMGLKTEQFTNTNPNFNVSFTVEDGGVKINPVDTVVVTIVGNHDTKSYDGKEHTASGYTVTNISNPLYTAAYFSFNGTAEAKRTEAGKTDMGLTAARFSNTNTNFTNVTFQVTDGYMEITPVAEITVTIKGHTAKAEYDGQEHSVTGYDVEIGNDLYKASDIGFAGSAEAKTTDAAKVPMGLKAEDFVNNNPNFSKVNFVVVDGGIEVTPKNVTVTVTGNTDSKPYDGTEHTVTGYKVETGNDLLTEKDITFTGTAEAKRTDAGTTPMGLSDKDFANTNPNFHVDFNVIDGGMTITPAAAVKVTVTGNHDTVTYDGKEHTVIGYTFTADNAAYTAADFTYKGKAEAKQTNAGTGYMELDASLFQNTNPNFPNVVFEVVDGYIKVEPLKLDVTVTGSSDTFTYDGKEHKVTGYTVTSDSDLYTKNDVAFSGTAEAKLTEVGEAPMGLTKDDFTNTNPNFDVTFTVEDGGIKIVPADEVVVTIIGNHDSKVYDGKEHTASGYTFSASNPAYKASHFSFIGTAEAKQTDVGKKMMELKPEQFANTSANFTKVSFEVTDGYMEITPVPEITVTIKGHSDTAEYDGQEHSVTGYDVEIGNNLYKASDFTFKGNAEAKTTDAAKVPMGLKAEDFVNNNPNFAKVNFVVTDGGIEVTPKNVTVTVTGNTDTAAYDGTEHTVTGYKVETGNDLLTEKDITFTGTAEAKRTDAGTTPMGLSDKDFANTNPNFNVSFEVIDGGITVEPLESITVVIKGHTDTVTYDGEEHTVTGYDVEIKTPGYSESDIGFTGNAEVKGTDADHYEMGLKPEDFVNNNPNVKEVIFEVTDGGLELKALDVKVTIEGTADSHVYDGQEHEAEGYSFTSDSQLYTQDMLSFTGTASAKRTDVGKTDMGIKSEDFANTNSNFNVAVTVKDGSMTITPVKEVTVTITGHKSTAVYDGTEHTASGYDVTVSDLLYTAQDFTFTGTAEAKRTNAGETFMNLKADQFVNNNPNFESVKFVVTDGSMTITPLDVKVTVTGHSDTVSYDGEEHTVTGYEITGDSNLFKPEDVTFTGNDEAKRTEAGKTDMGLKDDQFRNNNENFNFTFEITDGGITIEPITDEVVVTLKGNTAGGVYNGQDYVAEGYTVESISNELYKESFFSLANGKEAKAVRKDVGKTEMGLTAGSFVNNSQSFTNVRFEVVDGYVEVTPAKVTVTVDDKTVTYGEEEPELTVTVTGTIGDDTVDYDITRDPGDDAGDHKVTVTGDEEQGNYVVEYVDGKVTVEARTLIITAGDMQWEYDGSAHTGSEKPDNFTVGSGVAGQGLVGTDSVAGVTFSGSIKLPGTTDNIASNAVFASGSASNYDIHYVPGTLKVTDRSVKYTVTVTADSAEFLYDGSIHAVNSFSVNAAANNTLTAALTGSLPKSTGSDAFSIGGVLYTVSGLTAYGERMDAGKALVSFSGEPVIIDDEGNDVTAQFSVNRISGQITVNPRKVTLQSDNAAKVYDGTALTNHNLIIGGADGFVPGEGVTASITGSQTAVGTSQNAFTYTFNENTKASNYDVTVLFGNLSVYDIPVYRLTIHYVYEDGTQAAADYHGAFAAGEAYTVISPAIDGYHADALYIRSGAKGMPAANVEFTVTYRKDTVPEKGVEIVPDPTDPSGYDLTVIEEDEVPLASGGHVDDIMHFLLMAAALVVQLVYFKKRKKYTEEIFDLHKQLGDTDMDDTDDMN